MTVSQDYAKARYGGVKPGSAFLGFATSIGMIVILAAILAAVGYGLGNATGTGTGDALTRTQQETGASSQDLGIAGSAIALAVVLLSYLAGGYVAGRMARFNGLRQGVAVWLWAVVVAVVLAVLAATVGGADREDLAGPGVLRPELGEIGIGLAVVAVVALLGAVLGGLAGMRFHRRVDRAAATAPAEG